MNKPLNSPESLVQDLVMDIELEEISPDGRIGIVALSTDYNIEQDMRRMLPPSVEVFTNRVMYKNPMTLENLRAMAGDIDRAAEGILPGQGVDVVIYGCTSGTSAIGFDRIESLIQQSHPGAPVTTPLTAACAAFSALGASRVSVLTPYNRKINEDFIKGITEYGIEVTNLAGLNFDNDIDVTKVPPSTIKQAAIDIFDDDADALFISCTAFRASLVIEEIEQAIGKPVVSSNQALAWHALRLLEYRKPVEGYGSLFSV